MKARGDPEGPRRLERAPERMLIIGIGSPFGDDRAGCTAAERLKRSPRLGGVSPERVGISVCDRPGAMLLREWRDATDVVLIDAVSSGAAPGTIHRLRGEQLGAADATVSSHRFGVEAAIALARSLDALPPRLLLLGIEIDPGHRGGGLSDPVRLAVPECVRCAEVEIDAFLQGDKRARDARN